MQLSEHFKASELGVEGCELRVRSLAEFLCEDFLEKLRAEFNASVIVHDGYRDKHHNDRVGGKTTSWHLFIGDRAAVDFHVDGVDLVIVFEWLRLHSNLKFDKVILEQKNGVPECIHLQAAKFTVPRLQAFIGGTGDSKNYEEVTVAFAKSANA